MSKQVSTTPTAHAPAANFTPLTDKQYERWATLGGISVKAVREYHERTGKAPKPGFRSINTSYSFPGLLQLHARIEAEEAMWEAMSLSSCAGVRVELARAKLEAAERHHRVTEATVACHLMSQQAHEEAFKLFARQY